MSLKFPTARVRHSRGFNNTEATIMQLLRTRITLSANVPEIVYAMWPGTKQPEKKSRTITSHLRALERCGFVRRVGVLWVALPGVSG